MKQINMEDIKRCLSEETSSDLKYIRTESKCKSLCDALIVLVNNRHLLSENFKNFAILEKGTLNDKFRVFRIIADPNVKKTLDFTKNDWKESEKVIHREKSEVIKEAKTKLSRIIQENYSKDSETLKRFKYCWSCFLHAEVVLRDYDQKKPEATEKAFINILRKLVGSAEEGCIELKDAVGILRDQWLDWKLPLPEAFADDSALECVFCGNGKIREKDKCCPQCGKPGSRKAAELYFKLREAFKANNLPECIRIRDEFVKNKWQNERKIKPILEKITAQEQRRKANELLNSIESMLREVQPPRSGKAQRAGDSICVQWSRARLHGQEIVSVDLPDKSSAVAWFHLVRSEGCIPRSREEGTLLTGGGTQQLTFTDKTAEEGVLYGYAVFVESEYGGGKRIPIGEACPCGMAMRLPKPNLRCSAGEKNVLLSWKMPRGKWRATLQRREGNTCITLNIRGNAAEYDDTTVQTGHLYEYVLRLESDSVQEAPVEEKVSCTPMIRPRAIRLSDWQLNGDGTLSYTYPEERMRGVRVLWYSGQSIPGTPDTMCLLRSIAVSRLIEGKNGMVTLPDNSDELLVPLVVSGDYALICQPRFIGANHLKIRRDEGMLELSRFRLSRGEQAEILYDYERFPEDVDATDIAGRMSYTDSGAEVPVILNIPDDKVCYISVFRKLGKEWVQRSRSVSAPVKQRIKLECSITDGKLLCVRSKGAIPALQVYAAGGRIPHNKWDGEKVADIPASGDKSCSVALPPHVAKSGYGFRVFVQDEALAPLYQMMLNRNKLMIK